MADEKKYAAYVCTGCGIGDRLDPGQLETIATRDGKMPSCKQHEMLCSNEGIQMIRGDIDNDGVTHIVVAACSQRAKVEAFSFTDVAMSRANLREGVIWARPDADENQETTQEMADDYIRMACAEIKHMMPPTSSGEQGLTKNLLVVGGGITGMTAALEAAAAGYPVHLVEKSAELGGWAAQLHKRTPSKAAAAGTPNGNNVELPQPEDTGVAAMIAAVEADDNITVHLNSTVTKTSGAPGRFASDITTESGSTTTENFGAIIQASGYTMYDPSGLSQYGYTSSADVVTNMEMEALAKAAGDGPIKRPSDGKEVTSVAFVQNVGQCSQEEGQLPYHSGIGDMVAIKQAIYLKDQNEGCETTILFDNLRTPGAAGEDFYRSGQQKMITFAKGDVTEVVAGGTLKVKFKDLILNEDTEMDCDLVVLDVGMVPNSGPDPYASGEALESMSEEDRESTKTEIANSVTVDSILNLDYRQGTDLPHLKQWLYRLTLHLLPL